ncbi:MAG: DUF1257 domain-containing protein [Thermostichales cyanobacterium BF4_bins_65]
MSHFTTIQVQIKDGTLLRQVLQELGYDVVENGVVRGYLWQRTRADYVIKQKNGFDIGFRRQQDHYELITDIWGSQMVPEEFLRPILQKYAHKKLLRTLQEQGATIEAEETLPDGTIRVVVGQWQ